MEKFKNLLSWLKTLPVWLRCLILALVAGLILCLSLTSCGQTVKVTVRDTTNGVEISTTQTKRDSSGTNIHINPNISYQK